MMQLVINQFKNKNKIPLNTDTSKYINNLVVNEYIENSISKCDTFPFKNKKSRFFIFERERLKLLPYGQKEL